MANVLYNQYRCINEKSLKGCTPFKIKRDYLESAYTVCIDLFYHVSYLLT